MRSYVNHSIYAQVHGLDYRLECAVTPGVTNKFFYKTLTVKRVLPRYDWVVWIDDDAYITDFERDAFREHILAAEEAGQFMVIAEGPLEPNGMFTAVNAGVFAVKNCPESFELLDAMSTENVAKAEAWWRPEEHGTFTGADQEIIPWWIETTGRTDQVRIVEHRSFNSRGHYYENSLSDAFLMHFCGYPDKKIGVVAFAERFNIGQELVPAHLLEEYCVQVKSPMKAPERRVRTWLWHARGRYKPYLKPIRDGYRQLKSARA